MFSSRLTPLVWLVALVLTFHARPAEGCFLYECDEGELEPGEACECENPNYRFRYGIRTAGDTPTWGPFAGESGSACFSFDVEECRHVLIASAPSGGSFMTYVSDRVGETADLLTVKVDYQGHLHIMFHAQRDGDGAPYIHYTRADIPNQTSVTFAHLFEARHGRYIPPKFRLLQPHGQSRTTPIVETRGFEIGNNPSGWAGYLLVGSPYSVTSWEGYDPVAAGQLGGGISSMNADMHSGVPSSPGAPASPHGAVVYDTASQIYVRYSRGSGGTFVDLSNVRYVGRGFSPTVAIQSTGPGPMDYIGHIAYRGEGDQAGTIKYGQFSERPNGIFKFDLISSNIKSTGFGRVHVAVYPTTPGLDPITLANTPVHLVWYDYSLRQLVSVRNQGGFSSQFGFHQSVPRPSPFNEIGYGQFFINDPIHTDSEAVWLEVGSRNQVPFIRMSSNYLWETTMVSSFQPFDPDNPSPTPVFTPTPTPSVPVVTPTPNPCGLLRSLVADRILGRDVPCPVDRQDHNFDNVVDAADFFYAF